MDNQALAEQLVEAYEYRDWDLLDQLLADDFQFSGPVPEPLGPDQYVGVSRLLTAACSDISYAPQLIAVDGDVAVISLQLSGTHDGDMDLRFAGMDVIPPTGIAWSNVREEGEAVMADGKIVSIHLPPMEGAGLPAILAQIGVG